MDTPSTPYRVHECSKCPGDTEYYCLSCPCDLCPQCKENHVKDLKTIDHNVMSYCNKFKNLSTQEICQTHSKMILEMYCVPCELPVCYHCSEHRTHTWMDIQKAYQKKRQQQRKIIHDIRSDALFFRPVFLKGSIADIKTCLTKFSHYQSEMFTKAQRLMNLINKSLCRVDFKHRCLKQIIEINKHIVTIERYVKINEESAFKPLHFLSFIKESCLPQIQDSPLLHIHTSQLFMTESLNKENVIESLSEIQITERGNRRVENECLLTRMAGPEFHQSFTVSGVSCCQHISFVASDRFWVSGVDNSLILSNTAGNTLHHLDDLIIGGGIGSHTMNGESELIYINSKYNIRKLSKDMKTTTTFIDITNSTLRPRCLYWSKSTGDILIGMHSYEAGKVTRYNQFGQITQTIPDQNTRQYISPNYITENNNGDIVVSDYISFSTYGAVVVTNRSGEHRFSYTGYPSLSSIQPRGICTDALSHILVCDGFMNTVQMLNKDGRFLSYLLLRPSGISYPHNLSYDVNTYCLWVGSQYGDNKICVYRYIPRDDSLTDIKPAIAELRGSLSDIPTTGTQNKWQWNGRLLKLMSLPELKYEFAMTSSNWGIHINYVTTEVFWVSDINTVYSYDLDGDNLEYAPGLCDGDILTGSGSHTVNKKAELIYIDTNYNIKILPISMETVVIFIEIKDRTQKPRCVYGSLYTGDLLVGMFNYDTQRGSVFRYDQNGQLTQTIQNDNTGRELYNQPNYIIENENGDVVVSDCKFEMFGTVVVTERGGRHRFSYTGHPSKSRLMPRGICTDVRSHILVCDYWTNSVQIIDKDGQFLSHLLINSEAMVFPHSLSYDMCTHDVWVGSFVESKVSIYKYLTSIDEQGALTNEDTHRTDVAAFPAQDQPENEAWTLTDHR